MHTLRMLKNVVLFSPGPEVTEEQLKELEDAGVPLSDADCRTCEDPCEEHESYPARFDVDMESPLLGSIKPFRRQIVISTGKSDWPREVTDVSNTLAAHMLSARDNARTSSTLQIKRNSLPGVFHSSETESSGNNVTILNSNLKPMDEAGNDTVLVFPDYKLVTGVPSTRAGAQQLWDLAIDPSLGRAGSAEWSDLKGLSTWLLPYGCVIMLCSHKKRDNRCGISAPILEREFIRVLSALGWTAHTSLPRSTEDLDPALSLNTSPKSNGNGNAEAHQSEDEHIVSQLKTLLEDENMANSALVLRNSHVGGHKFVGNCIIYTPQGAGIWYGRVTPHDVEAIVQETVIGGRILPKLLRGGVNLSRGTGKCGKSLVEW